MRLWIVSDLHTEHHPWAPPAIPDADACVIAGDVKCHPGWALDWISSFVAPHMPVVMVAGNHESYGGYVIRDLRDAQRKAAKLGGIYLLENSATVLGGVRFVGATLWTDYCLDAESDSDVAWHMRNAQRGVYDFAAIIGIDPGEPPTPAGFAKLHARSRKYIDRTLATPFPGASVVVTHHAPHPDSISEAFRGSDLNAAYASDLSDLILARRPNMWVHGHVHQPCDYWVGTTRVVCNPKGFGNENAGFDPGLVVEV